MKRTAMAMMMLASGMMITSLARPARAQTPVQFKTSDGVTIYANYYPATASSQPMILLFHQAQSSVALPSISVSAAQCSARTMKPTRT